MTDSHADAGGLRRLLKRIPSGRGIVGVSLLKIVALGAGFLTTLMLAAMLGPEGLGNYAFAFSLVQLLLVPLLQGLPTLVLRDVAKAADGVRAAVGRSLLRFADRVVFAVGVVGFLALVTWRTVGGGQGPGLLEAAALAVPLLSVASLVRGAVARAYGHAVTGQLPELLIRPVLFASALFLLDGMVNPGSAMALHAAAALVACLVAMCVVPSEVSRSAVTEPVAVRRTLRAMLPLSAIAGMQLVNAQIDVVLVGALSDASAVGHYRVAASAAMQVSFLLAIVNAVLAPRFATLFRDGRIDDLRRLNRAGAALSFLFGAGVTTVFALAGRPAIAHFLGTEFLPSYAPLLILSGAHLLSLWAGTTNVLLSMIGHERDVLRAAAIAAGANVILGVVLVPTYGAIGAAAGSGLSLLVWRGILSWYLARRLAEAAR